MWKRAPLQPGSQKPDWAAAIRDCLERMHALRAEINSDQAEIDRLRLETRAILSRLRNT
jgi:hypothetical protein